MHAQPPAGCQPPRSSAHRGYSQPEGHPGATSLPGAVRPQRAAAPEPLLPSLHRRPRQTSIAGGHGGPRGAAGRFEPQLPHHRPRDSNHPLRLLHCSSSQAAWGWRHQPRGIWGAVRPGKRPQHRRRVATALPQCRAPGGWRARGGPCGAVTMGARGLRRVAGGDDICQDRAQQAEGLIFREDRAEARRVQPGTPSHWPWGGGAGGGRGRCSSRQGQDKV